MCEFAARVRRLSSLHELGEQELFFTEIGMIHFTLLSRSYCHLCDDMRIALERQLGQLPFRLDVHDIDLAAESATVENPLRRIMQGNVSAATRQVPKSIAGNAELLAIYDELVPVLFGRLPDGTDLELCHYFLNQDVVSEFVSGI